MDGVFLIMGRGIGGILAGYLNYWRPNLPVSQVAENVIYKTNITTFFELSKTAIAGILRA